MNPGILTSGYQPPPMPYGLLGRPTAIAMPDRPLHIEAHAWAERVSRNRGTVSRETLAAVSKLCFDIDAAGLRDRFLRLNLMCGSNLAACLVPLYRGQSLAGAQRGLATDTNVNFVAGDYSLTAGLRKPSNTDAYLDTGLLANTIAGNALHMGAGVLNTETRTGYRFACGALGGNQFCHIELRSPETRRAAYFGDANATSSAGPFVNSAPLAAGNVIAAYPNFFVNAVATGAAATTFFTATHVRPFFIFALNLDGSPFGFTEARLGWYSIGLTMTRPQIASLNQIIASYYSTIGRA